MGDGEVDLDGKDNLQETQSHADDILKKLNKQARLKQRKKQNRSKSDETTINESETQPAIEQDDSTNRTPKKVKVKSDQEKNAVEKKGKKKGKSKLSSGGDDGENELSAKNEGRVKRKKSSGNSSLSGGEKTLESSFEELPSSKKRKVKNNNDSRKSQLDVSDKEIIGVDRLKDATHSYSQEDDDSHLLEEEDESMEQEEGDKSGEFESMMTEGQAHVEVGGFTVIGDVEQKSVQKVMIAKIVLQFHW